MDSRKSSDNSLNGTWRVIDIEAAGDPVPRPRVQNIDLRYAFSDGTVTISRPDRPDQTGPFETDLANGLGRLLLKHQEPSIHAVYEIAGNTLRIGVMVDESRYAEFPADLVSRPYPKTDVLILERV